MPFHSRIRATLVLACMVASAATASHAQGADERDHPLVGRYDGAEIAWHSDAAFDEALLLKGPMDYNQPRTDADNTSWLRIEGKVTSNRYTLPAGRSSLEVYRNYEMALGSKGFVKVFACVDTACLIHGDRSDVHQIGERVDPGNGNPIIYYDHARYILARLDRPGGAVYASILVGERQRQATAFVQVVEARDMEAGKIVVLSANEMGDKIRQTGHVDIHSILFDFDRADIKPESTPTLEQIAQLLRERPALRLRVIGHTDNMGGADYNLHLSRRRAAAVVGALEARFGIAAGRLTSAGEGFSRPVASNDTDDGRAQNRRVELVAQ